MCIKKIKKEALKMIEKIKLLDLLINTNIPTVLGEGNSFYEAISLLLQRLNLITTTVNETTELTNETVADWNVFNVDIQSQINDFKSTIESEQTTFIETINNTIVSTTNTFLNVLKNDGTLQTMVDSAIGTLEPWTELLPIWLGGGDAKAYYRKSFGVLYLYIRCNSSIINESANTFETLPTNHRPLSKHIIKGYGLDIEPYFLTVDTDGSVELIIADGASVKFSSTMFQIVLDAPSLI